MSKNYINPQFYTLMKKLQEATSPITQVVEDLESKVKDLDEAIVNFEEKEKAMAALDATYENKFREAEIDLKLRMKENAIATIMDWAKANDYSVVSAADFKVMQDKAKTNDQEVSKLIGQVESTERAKYSQELKNKENQYLLEKAELQASYNVAIQQIKFLEQQLEQSRSLATQSMENAQRMVEAATKTSVNVHTGK